MVPVREFSDDLFLLFATRKGLVKKTALSAYGNIRTVGLNAINIREGDELIDVRVTTGDVGGDSRHPQRDGDPFQ